MLRVLEISAFTRSWRKLKLSEADKASMVAKIADGTLQGDVIRGGHGLRKIRIPLTGRGKSGGARVIYAMLSDGTILILAACYAKSDQEDLDRDELYELIEAIKPFQA